MIWPYKARWLAIYEISNVGRGICSLNQIQITYPSCYTSSPSYYMFINKCIYASFFCLQNWWWYTESLRLFCSWHRLQMYGMQGLQFRNIFLLSLIARLYHSNPKYSQIWKLNCNGLSACSVIFCFAGFLSQKSLYVVKNGLNQWF